MSRLLQCLAIAAASLIASLAMAQHVARPAVATPDTREFIHPAIANDGKVVALPAAAQQPRTGSKLVVDLTRGGDPAKLNPAIEKVARYVNIYRGAGATPADVDITVVLHGDATLSVLKDDAYSAAFQTSGNPNLDCLRELHSAGVNVLVCGQSLAGKGRRRDEIADIAQVAVSALTALVNHQSDGYAYIPLLP